MNSKQLQPYVETLQRMYTKAPQKYILHEAQNESDSLQNFAIIKTNDDQYSKITTKLPLLIIMQYEIRVLSKLHTDKALYSVTDSNLYRHF